MKRMSKLLAMLMSLAMVLSVCGMTAVFAEGEYEAVYGTNNMIRIELGADYRTFEAGVFRTFEFDVPEDGTYYAILSKVLRDDAEGKYDRDIPVSLNFYQNDASDGQVLNYTLSSDIEQNANCAIERVGNNVAMNVDLTQGTWKLDLTAESATGFNYIELRDTRLKLPAEKLYISPFDFKAANLGPYHVNEQVAFGYKQTPPPSDYTLVGNYLDEAIFDQSTTAELNKYRFIHIQNGSSADYEIDVETAGYYQISTYVNLYAKTYPASASLTVNVDGAAVSELPFTKESEGTPDTLIPSRAIYLSEGTHTLQFKNTSGTGMYVFYILAEPVDANKVVKVDDNFTRIEFAKQEGKATLNSEDGLSVTKTVDLVGGTYAVFVKKPVEFYGDDCVYNVTFSQEGSDPVNVSVAAATNTDSKNKGFSYERVGDTKGTTFTVPDGEVEFTLAVSKDCDVEYIDLRRLDLPLTGGKQAIAVADFSYVDGLNSPHCSQQFGTGNPSHVLPDYPLIGDYFSNKITPSQKYYPIHLSKDATVGYTVDVEQAGWYRFGVVINTYKSNGILSLYNDDNLVDSVTYTYTTDPQPDLTYTYNAAYLSAGRHTIKLNASVGGIYLYRFTTEKLEGDPVYEFAGGSATVMQSGMNSEADIDGEFRVLNQGDTVSFKLSNVYEDPQGKNEYTLKLAVDTAAVPDAAVDVKIGETVYPDMLIGGKNGDVTGGTIVVPEGESEVVITSKTDGVKLKSVSLIETVITSNELGNTMLSILRASEISEGVTPDAAGSASFTAEQFVTFDVNITAAGAYMVRMNAKSPQTGFTVYVDDEDYTDSQYLEVNEANAVNNSKNQTMVKNAATNIHLTEGLHTIKVVFHDVDSEAVTHTVNEIYLRRVDKTVDSTTPIQIGTLDYIVIDIPTTGWNLAAQHGQGSTYKGDELYGNVVFMGNVSITYEFNVAETGFYKISNFGGGPEGATQKSTYAIDGGSKVSETEFTYVGENADKIAEYVYNDYAYLTEGKHTLTIYATDPSEQAVRMNMTKIEWVADVEKLNYNENTMEVSYQTTSLNAAADATVYIAAYAGNRLVGIGLAEVKAGDTILNLTADVTKAPDKVKILTLDANLKPLTAEKAFGAEDF